jgi:hypothetical protein
LGKHPDITKKTSMSATASFNNYPG